MRKSGILMHISSLPSDYGIGTLGPEAFRFVDFLSEAGQKLWQILPVTPTSYGDSPYQSFSTFAGNPYFIDLDLLCEEGLLKREEYFNLPWGENPRRVDYARIYELRYPILRKAFSRFWKKGGEAEYEAFLNKNREWLNDYALYMAVKGENASRPWVEWEDRDLRFREEYALVRTKERLAEEIEFWRFLQYKFFSQWNRLTEYIHSKGIELIGDLPIYVSLDSADVWANPDIFLLDEEHRPIEVAGCPPDYFSETGQLWGNPVYDWDTLSQRNYDWWMKRVQAAFSVYDIVRMDHFRGFESFYSIPAEARDARNGKWRRGPGIAFFQQINKIQKDARIIAEDLGMITDEVRALLGDCGYPGMKVLQFAFSPGIESAYMPHNHIPNCVCYTGTHDNDTLWGWLSGLTKEELDYLREYTCSQTLRECGEHILAMAWGSVADTAIATLQDFLGIGSEGRMNTPGSSERNWSWRAEKGDYGSNLAERIRILTKTYWR